MVPVAPHGLGIKLILFSKGDSVVVKHPVSGTSQAWVWISSLSLLPVWPWWSHSTFWVPVVSACKKGDYKSAYFIRLLKRLYVCEVFSKGPTCIKHIINVWYCYYSMIMINLFIFLIIYYHLVPTCLSRLIILYPSSHNTMLLPLWNSTQKCIVQHCDYS